MRHVLLFVGCAALVVGCGSYPKPTDAAFEGRSHDSRRARSGRRRVPAAALSVKLAQEEVQKAKQLMEDGDNKRAELILMRAQADAELALAQAREHAGQERRAASGRPSESAQGQVRLSRGYQGE